MTRGARGQATLEVALLVPVLLLLLLGLLGVTRVAQARLGVAAAAREAARTAVRQVSIEAGEQRGREVAAGYGLDAGALVLVVGSDVARPGGFPGDIVAATATYRVTFGDLPLLQWGAVTVAASSRERVDRYRGYQR